MRRRGSLAQSAVGAAVRGAGPGGLVKFCGLESPGAATRVIRDGANSKSHLEIPGGQFIV